MDKAKAKRLYRDLALIGFLLLLSAGLFLGLRLGKTAGAGVVVRVDGQETARYSLSQNGRYALNNGSNILVIENGEAYLVEANCPDKLCVRQGRIRSTGQVITCLPNRLTVTVYGADSGVDIYT